MTRRILFGILACLLPPAFNSRAVQSGAGHYISGQYADFSGLPPTQSGLYLGNYYHNYENGNFSATHELPFGRILFTFRDHIPTTVFIA